MGSLLVQPILGRFVISGPAKTSSLLRHPLYQLPLQEWKCICVPCVSQSEGADQSGWAESFRKCSTCALEVLRATVQSYFVCHPKL